MILDALTGPSRGSGWKKGFGPGDPGQEEQLGDYVRQGAFDLLRDGGRRGSRVPPSLPELWPCHTHLALPHVVDVVSSGGHGLRFES